jgi:hypothetical protein
MLKAREFEDVVIREDYEFQMPLNTKLVAAWQRATNDPEVHVVTWARQGVPLGMAKRIETCGIFPAARDEALDQTDGPPLDLLENTRNDTSFYDLLDAATEEINRYVNKGFAAVRLGMAQRPLQLRDHFPYGPHTEDQGRRQGQKPSVGGHAALRWQCAEFSAGEADTAKSPGHAAGSSQTLQVPGRAKGPGRQGRRDA